MEEEERVVDEKIKGLRGELIEIQKVPELFVIQIDTSVKGAHTETNKLDAKSMSCIRADCDKW